MTGKPAATLRDLIADQSLFEGLAPGDLDFLAGCGKLVHIRPGELVFREGDPAEHCYVLRNGEVAVGMHVPERGRVAVGTVEAGELLGWSWLFPPERWRLDAIANSECSLFAFDARCLVGKFDEQPYLGYVVMTRLARQTSEHLMLARMQLLDLYNDHPEERQPFGGGAVTP